VVFALVTVAATPRRPVVHGPRPKDRYGAQLPDMAATLTPRRSSRSLPVSSRRLKCRRQRGRCGCGAAGSSSCCCSSASSGLHLLDTAGNSGSILDASERRSPGHWLAPTHGVTSSPCWSTAAGVVRDQPGVTAFGGSSAAPSGSPPLLRRLDRLGASRIVDVLMPSPPGARPRGRRGAAAERDAPDLALSFSACRVAR